jgi:hypothetical protein
MSISVNQGDDAFSWVTGLSRAFYVAFDFGEFLIHRAIVK